MALTVETCESCGKAIKGKMVACFNEGRILCLSCDKAARREVARAEAERYAVARLWEPKQFFSRIAGVTHRNGDGTDRQHLVARLVPGQPLALMREPHNQYSATAIAITNQFGKQLGYVVDETSSDLATRIDAGVPVWARVKQLTGGGELSVGVNIEVMIGYQAPAEISWSIRG